MKKEQALAVMRTNTGETVSELSQQHPVLVIFLRHFGCTFCREALADIASERKLFQEKQVETVLVHMTDDKVANKYFDKYDLQGVRHVSDPTCAYYKAFGLLKGNFHQLFGLQSWIRGFQAGIIEGHRVGYQQLGDGFQMPGAFTIRNGEIINAFVHKVASDRPDYWKMIEQCEVVTSTSVK